MSEEIKLVLSTVEDAEVIHQMQCKAFLPLYEKSNVSIRKFDNKDAEAIRR